MISPNAELVNQSNIEIIQDGYQVIYEVEPATVRCKGSLRLNDQEEDYKRINGLLDLVIETEPPTVTLNLQELHFLNSLGINMLSKFVIKVRKKKFIKVIVQGNTEMPWQEKSLKNLQRLMPSLDLQMQ
jgi:hypothetical protein